MGFVEEEGGAPENLEDHLVNEHTEKKNTNSHGWGLAGGAATACSNIDLLVPLGSLPYSEVLAALGGH